MTKQFFTGEDFCRSPWSHRAMRMAENIAARANAKVAPLVEHNERLKARGIEDMQHEIRQLREENERLKADRDDWKKRLAPELYNRIAKLEEIVRAVSAIDVDFIPTDDPFRHIVMKARAELGEK